MLHIRCAGEIWCRIEVLPPVLKLTRQLHHFKCLAGVVRHRRFELRLGRWQRPVLPLNTSYAKVRVLGFQLFPDLGSSTQCRARCRRVSPSGRPTLGRDRRNRTYLYRLPFQPRIRRRGYVTLVLLNGFEPSFRWLRTSSPSPVSRQEHCLVATLGNAPSYPSL